ncbi:MAG: hypothetical protein ACI9FB_001841 [Candidatus Azotimanducaceae bacterium]|jgi:hypothetical protein
MIEVLKNIHQVTPEWLTKVLKKKGLINSSVVAVEVEIIGAGVGLMAELARLTVTYQTLENISSTFVIKCAAQNDNRQIALILDFYNREVNFYDRIGNASGIRVPKTYFAGVDEENYDHTILMEDLGSNPPPDQLVGASEDEAFAAIGLIAGMHAKYWNNVADEDWMYQFMSMSEANRLSDMLYMPSLDAAFEKFDACFDDRTRKICQTVGERYSDFWFSNISKSETLIHGDYRQDNFVYPKDGSEVIVMDWQISGKGKGIFDVTYFICQSLQPELRQSIEKDIIRMWVDNLAKSGVKDYDFETAYRDYKYLILACLVYPITVCGSLDPSNERGRALGECMLTRNLIAIDELNCTELF